MLLAGNRQTACTTPRCCCVVVALLLRFCCAKLHVLRRFKNKIVVVAIFSNVSSGGSGCWPGAGFAEYQLYEGESVKMVQSGNIT